MNIYNMIRYEELLARARNAKDPFERVLIGNEICKIEQQMISESYSTAQKAYEVYKDKVKNYRKEERSGKEVE